MTVAQLKTCETELRAIYDQLTPKHDHQQIRSLIRQAFAPLRDFKVTEEVVPQHAALLQIEKLISPIEDFGRFYPSQQEVHDIIEWDNKPAQEELKPEVIAMKL